MTAPICTKCHYFMKPKRNGIYVLEMAGEMPYKLWAADLYSCPICGGCIVTGFALESTADYDQKKMYEIILNECFNDNPQLQIPVFMAYHEYDKRDCYCELKPNPMIWLENYCKEKLEKWVDNGV